VIGCALFLPACPSLCVPKRLCACGNVGAGTALPGCRVPNTHACACVCLCACACVCVCMCAQAIFEASATQKERLCSPFPCPWGELPSCWAIHIGHGCCNHRYTCTIRQTRAKAQHSSTRAHSSRSASSSHSTNLGECTTKSTHKHTHTNTRAHSSRCASSSKAHEVQHRHDLK